MNWAYVVWPVFTWRACRRMHTCHSVCVQLQLCVCVYISVCSVPGVLILFLCNLIEDADTPEISFTSTLHMLPISFFSLSSASPSPLPLLQNGRPLRLSRCLPNTLVGLLPHPLFPPRLLSRSCTCTSLFVLIWLENGSQCPVGEAAWDGGL